MIALLQSIVKNTFEIKMLRISSHKLCKIINCGKAISNNESKNNNNSNNNNKFKFSISLTSKRLRFKLGHNCWNILLNTWVMIKQRLVLES
jgi:hypothetical protein